jgi:glyoxylase-like metal-dependent hydrolase (beta-lactamase superfamily II)
MKLEIVRMVLGPLQNNVYLLADQDSAEAVIIDPSFEPKRQQSEIQRRGWKLTQIWLTHGHFDHYAGTAALQKAFTLTPLIGMHPQAYAWANEQKNAVNFGMPIDPVPQVDIPFAQGQYLAVSASGEPKVIEVREVPGHNPGSVLFYCEALEVAFTGDAIFRESIGRTDFPGGDFSLLLKSIREQVFSLPDETTLLPGHGPESSVAHEKQFNPYLA